MMIGRALRYVMLALAIGAASAARAEDFNFSYHAFGLSVMGIFNTTALGNGRYMIDSITNGTRGGNVISLLAPRAFDSNDNILYFLEPRHILIKVGFPTQVRDWITIYFEAARPRVILR